MSTFADRHIGPSEHEQAKMLAECGYGSLDALVEAAVPAAIRNSRELDLLPPAGEQEATAELRALAAKNRPMTQMIGLGFSDTITPPVIRRNVLESPAWYTAYTPYQPEISQGRLEALLNFQTMVSTLTGLDTANASLLDESTAVAEAVMLMRRQSKAKSSRVVLDAECLPQTIAVVRTRAEAVGIEVEVRDLQTGLPDEFFGVVVQYPGASGVLRGKGFYEAIGTVTKDAGALYTVAADLLALTLVTAPGEFGADITAGTTQRFGVPLGYGGPHAGYLAVRKGLERSLPGRLVGVSLDADGNPAYRLALQTREQHIRREKATSNICTAQVLPAVLAAMYAVYHGPDGLKAIAERVHGLATGLAAALREGGVGIVHESFFDTVLARVPGRAQQVIADARRFGINLGHADADHVRIACDEVTTVDTLRRVLLAFDLEAHAEPGATALPAGLARESEYLTHEVFHTHRSETSMLRYLRRLSDLDYALDRGMIPLGSCTMKLNATAEMEPISWPEFAGLHPFAPAEDAAGYRELIDQLCGWLAEVTGYDKVSLQPNAGSQGEFAGLLAIRAYHKANGNPERDVCLIPSSAHGTNAASAVLAGMRVVVVACRTNGDVDLEDLRAKVDTHRETLAAIMVTYPSTHGVYENGIGEIARLVHDAGGQVYVDGANLNALLGLAKPGEFGGDVSHLNLHKTFCIPHGGGGPGVGPVAVRAHLAPYLPGHPELAGESGVGPVSAAPYGSASILPISWAYVRMMGAAGLTSATKVAVLAANYVAARLSPHYPVLYTGRDGLVAHECILDLRALTKRTGVTVDDVAKRLVDYGFHAPTMSFPVAGTLMVEPTESEDVAEIDRFCDAMIAIRHEIEEVADGRWAIEQSPLRNAPHTAETLTTEWDLPYDRKVAVYPAGVSPKGKYWPPVRRIDGAYGDRNLVCSCPPIEAYGS
ncbi:aminomethyl-transferring glycine dehydrogenase [Amycolatopsis acidiphila]|uniref:Glycine dehydrogenase (decarboxylating) n=1 Tax=Amycolatopsis acidiphila TaxID=715473 RepID=A0A557ZYD8_9PSEU|nr:aminomethyl-transferring glycine dehydrogenase [Amycolatopsis acidiphila]TVT17014.1 aminomethyl-transferring glycine dehydrogenase [Amycolatopsis acidiphila]UIJ58578.1 aminomethyl-transferring glycine dehydrogenase [Amycolatopsis acidiphila]GHG76720.1 glycine dehydrogenase (decarboxylating) [Amycolatopsis acidiphila]